MMKKIKNIFPILLMTFLLSNCSKEPNSVGEDLLSNNENFISYTINLNSLSSRGYNLTTSNNSSTIMVGKYVDGNNVIEAKTLIQFTTTAVDSVFLNSIISTEIKMRQIYSMPDTSGVLSFSIHKMLKSWNDYSFTIDSLNSDSYDPVPVADYDLNVYSKDTLPVKFVINSALVKNWLQGLENFGIIFIPKPNNNYVVGFKSGDLFSYDEPELVITYQLPEDTSSKTLILKVKQDATVFSGSVQSYPNNILILQGGLIKRGVCNFSIDSIPRASSLLQANLILYVDTNFSRFSPFSLKKIQVQEIISEDSIPKLGSLAADNTLSGDSIIINIQQIVQKWIARKPNYGIALRAYNEFTEIDRIAIFNSYSSKPPRLQIKYLRLP